MQPATTPAAHPTPERLMQLVWGYAPPEILQAAVRTGLFDALHAQPATAVELARRLQLDPRAVRIVVEALEGLQFLARDADGRFHCTPESSTFLVSTSPASFCGLVSRISPRLTERWHQLETVLRTGKTVDPVNQEQPGVAFFQQLVRDIFPMSFQAARTLAAHLALGGPGPRYSVLDIAAGSGVWGIALAMDAPRVHLTAVDWAGVLPVTEEYATRFGVRERMTLVPGDLASADFGRDHQLAVLGHILHSEGPVRSQQLLRRVAAALAPGGTIAIAEFLVDDDRRGPPSSLIFGVNMWSRAIRGRFSRRRRSAPGSATVGLPTSVPYRHRVPRRCCWPRAGER